MPNIYDPNTEAYQMRAQWKKQALCRKMWHNRWNWLLEEQSKTGEEIAAAKREVAAVLPLVAQKKEITKSLKPVPVTSTGVIGWLATKPDCQLEIYKSWLWKPPLRLPDAWDSKDYICLPTLK